MIYPTRRAVLIAAAGAPVALLVGVIAPARWYAGLAWPLAVVLASLVDALTGAWPRRADGATTVPRGAPVGGVIDAVVRVVVPASGPRRLQATAAASPLLLGIGGDVADIAIENGQGSGVLRFTALRRGMARIDRLWLRWQGRFGLVWKQKRIGLDTKIPILPDLRPVHREAARLFQRKALQGLMAQLQRGEGSDYDSMVEYRSGMDRRSIDWKQSARHHKLHARDYRQDRNNQLVLAIDAGRQMAEPIAGLPRIDRVVSAALLTGWLALKLADRVSLFAFDARPRIASGAVSGTRAFTHLSRLAADIDYSTEETNYTLGLTSLAQGLTRRSTVILFTEFADNTGADLLVRAAGHLVKRHVLLVVVLKDEELEAFAAAEPLTADDVTRAVTAAAMQRERRLVLTRLRHLGAHIVESAQDRVTEELAQTYLALKRKDVL